MAEDREYIIQDEFRGAPLQIFGIDPDNPEEGRIFVWTKMGWFEREKGSSGDVAFIPVAKSETELRQFITRENPTFDLVPLGRKYTKMISQEFAEQSPSPFDSPEHWDEESPDEDDQEYHQHDL
jgi:hypothetical protein